MASGLVHQLLSLGLSWHLKLKRFCAAILMRCSRHNKLPSHSFLGIKFFQLFVIPPLDHLFEFALCTHKLRTVMTHHQCRLSSDSEESSQCLHKFNGRIIYSQLQVYSSRVHAGKDYSIMLGGCVSAYLHFVRSKLVTCCLMKWGRERFQVSSGQVSHELCFSSCFNFSAAHPSELYRLGQIMSSYDPKLCSYLHYCGCHSSVSSLMKVSSYQKRYPVVSGEHSRVFGFIGN